MVARCFKRHSSNSCHPRQSFVPLVLDAAGAEVLSLFPLSLCLLKEVSPIVRELHRAQGIFERVSFLSRCSLLSASWSGRRLLAFKPFLRGIRILVRPFPFPSHSVPPSHASCLCSFLPWGSPLNRWSSFLWLWSRASRLGLWHAERRRKLFSLFLCSLRLPSSCD